MCAQQAAINDAVAGNTIHIFNGFLNPYGGSELEALSLFKLLRDKAQVRLWATSSRVSPQLLKAFPIRRVAPHKGLLPDGGNYVFVGAHWRNKFWPYLARKPHRLIYVYNTFHPKVVALTSRMPRLLRWPRTEYVVISEFQKTLVGVDGEVHPSPIDIGQFIPAAQAPRAAGSPVIIGRMSRDTPDKHHADDLALYAALAQRGCEVMLQGASCIADRLPQSERIHVYPEGHFPAAQFLQGLDIFYYRTGAHVETFGRVVFEAMACGLPVVCHAHGGYADTIRHGKNGFLFDTPGQASEILDQLISDPELRAEVGKNARETVESLYSPSSQHARLAFYLK